MRVVPPVADPEAELARLRRPTGPWLHLLDAAPADARQLGWMLGQDGVVVRILRGHCGRSSYGFFDEVGAALQLPGDPAEDWAGLGSLLTDMGWLPGAGHVLVVTRAALLLAAEPLDELRGLVGAVREVARGRAEDGDPVPFHVVLQDDAAGLAALRERLGATGAKFDELSGWDAEEPAADIVVGRRSSFVPGEAGADLADLAAGRAAAEVDGVLEVGRAWEEFRGGAGGSVRVYAPVIVEPRRHAQVAGVIARAVAQLGAGCVVVPVPADAGGRDALQETVAGAVTRIWPVPEAPPEVVASSPGPAELAAVAPPQGERSPSPERSAAAERQAGPGVEASVSAGRSGPIEPAGRPDRSGGVEPPVPAEQPQREPVSASQEAAPPVATDRPVSAAHGTESPTPAEQRPGPSASPGQESEAPTAAGQGADQAAAGQGAGPAATGQSADPMAERSAGPTAEQSAGPTAAEQGADPAAAGQSPAPAQPADRPADRPGADFELVAANLEWPFNPGADTPDAVDAALVRHAGSSGRTAELFRTWVEDPDGGWVRVVLGYVARSSIADVEAERTAVVEVLQRTGAARCCVEVLAATDVGDVHRWLEERCTKLWPEPAPKQPAQPAPPPPATQEPLPPDVTFTAGPGADHPAIAELIAWATGTTGVAGLVTAYAGDELVVGVAVDGATNPGTIPRRGDLRIEPFAPSRGLDPVHLRLTRSATRVWTRRAERQAPEPQRAAQSAGLSRPDLPKVVVLGPPPVRDTEDARGDEQLDGGFVLVGIDRETPIAKGPPEPDDRDGALTAWATAEPTITALLRAQATVDEETFPVYTVAVTANTDLTASRRALAAAIAGTGVARAAAEAFDPSGVIPTFHLDLAVGSLRLYMR